MLRSAFDLVLTWLNVARDVTELKRAEREFREFQTQVLLELRDLKADLRRVEQESRLRDELLAAKLEQLADKGSAQPPARTSVRRRRR
ncbi:MAG TPA: hypothetical protein PKE47_03580 [Verrucomicrobiota bacterium]|nr:hypothetical protein [Verrucomicrobiota bacterium]